jgi:hypothetical protein
MSRGLGLLLLLFGSGLLLDDAHETEPHRSRSIGVLLLFMGSGLLRVSGE